jgi:hypothetical protein
MYQNATKSKSKLVRLANVVATSDDEPDGCWSAVFVGDVPSPMGPEVDTYWECEEAGASAALSSGLTAAAIMQVEEVQLARVELYDSGATHHISPYRDDFTTYRTLDPPMYLKAANGQQFPAVGTRDMVISAPNGDQEVQLTLEKVLHAPSVGTLDTLGYRIAIGGGHLEISSCDRKCLAHVAWTPRGLY